MNPQFKKYLALSLMTGALISCKQDKDKPAETEKKQETTQEHKPQEAVKSAETPKAETSKKDEGKPLAKFADGHVITQEQIHDLMRTLPKEVQKQPMEKVKKMLLDRDIDKYVLTKAAKEADFAAQADTQKKIAQLKENVIRKEVLEKKLPAIAEAEAKAQYQEVTAEFAKRGEKKITIRYIEAKSDQEAKDLITKHKADPQAFPKTAKEAALSTAELAPEVAKKIMAVPAGTVGSEPLPLGEEGFIVFIHVKTEDVTPPRLEDIRSEIDNVLRAKKAVKLVEDLRKEAGVKVFGLDGNPLPEPVEGKEPEPAKVDIAKVSDSQVAAEIGTRKITVADVKAFMGKNAPELPMARLPEVYNVVIYRIIDGEILDEQAKKLKVADSAETNKKIEDAVNMLVPGLYLETKASAAISQKDINDKYQELLTLLPKNEMEVQMHAIFLDTKEKAEEILKRLKSGSKFADLVSESVDEQTKIKGGELPWIRRAQLPVDAAKVLFTTANGTVAANPFKFGSKWAVAKVDQKRKSPPPALEEVKGELTNIVKTEKAAEMLKELRTKNGLELFDENGKPLATEPSAPKTAAAAA